MGVQLLAWSVDEADYQDPDYPGIDVDSPERRRVNALADRLRPEDRHDSYHFPTGRAVREALPAFSAFGGVGPYRDTVEPLRAIVAQNLATGQVAAAVWMLGILGRVHVVLGELDAAAEVHAEGLQLMVRVEPDSNAASQFEALPAFRAEFVDLDYATTLAIADRVIERSHRTDLRWVSGPLRVWRADLLAALGDHEAGLRCLSEQLPVIERAALGSGNYPIVLQSAANCLWRTGRADHAAVIEANLRAKVLEPDFDYAESDARWTAALLCGLTGRPDEARRWFDLAHERLASNGAVLLIPHVCCDEALLEARLGPLGERDRALRRLDEAAAWTERVGLPALRTRVAELVGLLGG